MLFKNSTSKSLRLQALLGVMVTSCFTALTAQTTQEDKNALVDYGESHPLIFILGILALVGIAVVVVYFVFKKTNKEPAHTFKPPQKSHRHPADRRYMSKKTMPR